MATGQTLLNLMEVLGPEMQLQSGEANVTRGLIVLNAAQDYMEALFALQPGLLGDGKGDVLTVQDQETTTFPSRVLRLDKLQRLDDNSRPLYDLRPIYQTGGQVDGYPSFYTATVSASGAPQTYFTDGKFIYWAPIPDTTYTCRWYGFKSQDDITASSTYAYPDITLLPLATFAVKIYRLGLDDDIGQYQKLGQETFEPVVSVLSNFRRDQAPGYHYRYRHVT